MTSQHGFIKRKLCFMKSITFHDDVIGLVVILVDEWTAVDVAYLDFSNVFDTVSHKILPQRS